MQDNIRPWGRYDILNESKSYKIKIITVQPAQRLSYQYHHKREEFWVNIKGNGLITLEGKEILFNQGDFVKISKTKKHRIKNIGSDELTFIEVQLGEYFGEDDIVRIEDDYNRSNKS